MASPSSSASGHHRSPSRRIIVAHRLPLRADPNPSAPHGFDFTFDPESLTLQLSRGLPGHVLFLGALPAAAEASVPDSDELAAYLLECFACYAVPMPPNLAGFSDQLLVPLARSTGSAQRYAAKIYDASITLNSMFVDRLLQILNQDTDLLYIHDFHLWALPAMLRHRSPRARMGFYLHSTFASADLLGAMPDHERRMILRSMLNADIISFHMIAYARLFVSYCASLLGIEGSTTCGDIVINYNGCSVIVVVLTVDVDVDQMFLASLGRPNNADYRARLLAVDTSDYWTKFKLLSVEQLLTARSDLRVSVVLVEITADDSDDEDDDIDKVITDVVAVREADFSVLGYAPIMLIEGAPPMWCNVGYWARSLDMRLQCTTVMMIPEEEGYLSRIFGLGMSEHFLLKLLSQNLQRLQDLMQDGDGAYTMGLRLGNLGSYLLDLKSGLAEANKLIDQALPYLELFGEVLGDDPISVALQNLAGLLKRLSKLMGKTNIALGLAGRLLLQFGLQLQLKHPHAQRGGKEVRQRASVTDIVMVNSVEDADIIITEWTENPRPIKVEVDENLSREVAVQIHEAFCFAGAHDMIRSSDDLLDKVQDAEHGDWVIA